MGYSLAIEGLFSVGAPTTKELETLIERALEIREEHADSIRLTGKTPDSGNGQASVPLARGLNVAKWEAKHGQRLRTTKEEKAQAEADGYRDREAIREAAAISRLINEGDSIEEGSAPGPIQQREPAAPALDPDELI